MGKIATLTTLTHIQEEHLNHLEIENFSQNQIILNEEKPGS